MKINSNPSASITVRKGEGDRDHNLRIFIAPNVDKNRIKDNVVFINETLQEAYRKNFDDSIRAYNIGKKPSRQKWSNMEHPADGYLAKLERDIAECTDEKKRKKLTKPFYEAIIQVGNMEDYGTLTHPQRAQIAKEILTKYMKEFQENNPRLYVFCAVLHMDEGKGKNGKINGGTPHLHIDYIPIACGLKQGLPVRNSLTQALAQQGIESGNNKNDNNNSVWQVQQIETIKKICDEHGIQTKVIGSEKRAYLTPDAYRALMAVNEQKLNRARAETDKTINNIVFGKTLVDVNQLKRERAITSVLREQYHDNLKEMEEEKERLRLHYLDSESDLQLEKQRVMQEKSQVDMIVKDAEYRGQMLAKREMQDEITAQTTRAISAERNRDRVLLENTRLKTELNEERKRADIYAERYVNLITAVKTNFTKVARNASVRKQCQVFFDGTVLYDIVRWRPVGREQMSNELSLHR